MAQAGQKVKSIISKYIRNLNSLGITVERIILFGSQTKGKFKKESDIDIAVISSDFEKMGLWDRAKYLGRAARDIPHPIESMGFCPAQLKNVEQGTMLYEITKRGIEMRV